MLKYIIALGLVSNFALANYKEFYAKRSQDKFSSVKSTATFWNKKSVESGEYDQKLDHFDSRDGRIFKQRYYINANFAVNSNSPVFLYICGEATCHSSSVTNGAIVEYARMFKGTIVALEHRYYGKSQPFANLTTENLKYLSTDQAIEDLNAFQKHITKEKNLNGKWVSIGGSYPGSLSAYYRLKYPRNVVAALASSAPVKAKADFFEYDAHVTKVVGEKCAGLMRDAVSEIEASLNDDARLTEIKKMFKASGVKNNIDFLYVIADIGAIAAQYGYVSKFCADLESGVTALEGYAQFGRYILKAWQMTPEEISIGGATSLNPADYEAGFGMRQWLYQSCTEYGYWQVADANNSTRSSLIDLKYHDKICDRLFGIKKSVDTTHINTKFYEPLLIKGNSSNILFTNGSTDPWLNLSVLPGEMYEEDNMSYMIDGAAHCDDLRALNVNDSSDLQYSRVLFINLLKSVL